MPISGPVECFSPATWVYAPLQPPPAMPRQTGSRSAMPFFLFQVPHHGSRNNISPSILNRIIGRPVPNGTQRKAHCVVSAGPEDKTHPRQVVVNALTRRGLEPNTTNAALHVRFGMDGREGYEAATPLKFQTSVEAYD
jgi:hypothetical protein